MIQIQIKYRSDQGDGGRQRAPECEAYGPWRPAPLRPENAPYALQVTWTGLPCFSTA